MIRIVGKNKIIEGKRNEFIKLAQELIEKSNKEEGCISYDLYEDLADYNTLTFIETWQDKQAVDVHVVSQHYKQIIPKLGKFVQEKDVRLYGIAK